jgi:SAM-dependent methyltransferase
MAKKILDIGCGTNKYKGAIGLDHNPLTDADVIHDLRDLPYPFADNEFDLVYAAHLVEHIPDVIPFVEELYRITRNGGTIQFITPHYTNPDWNCDPTHKNHFSSYSFQTFDATRRHFGFYTNVDLRPKRRYVTVLRLWKALGVEFLINIDHRSPGLRFIRKFWETYLCYMIRGKDLNFEFEVIKHPTTKLP